MEKLRDYLKREFSADLASEFKPYASYFDGMDYVEYMTVNTTTVSKRIDENLTIIMDRNQSDVVGFRIKGFKYFFNEHLKSIYKLQDNDFLTLRDALVALVQKVGDAALQEESVAYAYKKAFQLASDSETRITEFNFRKAA